MPREGAQGIKLWEEKDGRQKGKTKEGFLLKKTPTEILHHSQ